MNQAADLSTTPSQSALPVQSMAWLVWRKRLLFALPVVLYLLARVPALLSLPLFNDEAVYLLRAQHFPQMFSWTAGEGKLLQELVLAALVQLPGDPLWWNRLFSVVCGLGTLVAMLLIGRVIDQPRAGILAAMLYAGAPMAVLHDRLGLPDSMLTATAAYLLLISIWFAQSPYPTRYQAVLIGVTVGVAMLAKLPGLFFSFIPVLTVLALADSWAQAQRRLSMLRVAMIVVLVFLAALLLIEYGITERNKIDLGSPGERFTQMVQYLRALGTWLLTYLPAPLLLLPLFTLALGRHLRESSRRMVALLLLCGLALHGVFLLLGNTLYPRYLMPAWPPLLVSCAVGAAELWQVNGQLRALTRVLCIAVIGAVMAWDGFFVLQLQFNPVRAPMVATDREQYLETWTVGYGIPEMLDLVGQLAAEQHGILLVNHYQPRLIHLAPQIYLSNNALVSQRMLNLRLADAPARLRAFAVSQPTYVLLDEQERQAFDFVRRFPETRLLRSFENPLGTMRFYLYEQPRSPASPQSAQ